MFSGRIKVLQVAGEHAYRRADYMWLVPLGLCATLIASCLILSARKYYWNDELFSYYLLTEPSFARMLAAFGDRINNTPIVYFLIGWVWAQIFGASELSLRLFSSLGMCLAALISWILLRGRYGIWPASFATVGVFGFSFLVLQQNVEARMYGLYLALAVLALLQFDRSQRDQPASTAAALKIGCTHALLLHTHLFGIFYSATIVATGIAVDWCRGRWQPRIYIALSASWLSLLAYMPTFLVQADAGRPRTWIPEPTLGDLGHLYIVDLRFASLLLAALLLVQLWLSWGGRAAPAQPRPGPPQVRNLVIENPTLVLGWLFLLVPVGVWLVSLTVKPIFYPRYLLPSLLGAAVVIAYLLAGFDRAAASSRGVTDGKIALSPPALVGRLYGNPVARRSVLALMLVLPVLASVLHRGSAWRNITEFDYGHSDIPIVVQYSNTFLSNLFYDAQAYRYAYILDWDTAVAPESGTFPPQEYKHLEALLRHYPERFSGHIVGNEAFLSAHDRFLVLDYANYDYACDHGQPWYSVGRNLVRWQESLQCPRWLEGRILPDPRYRVAELGRIVNKEWAVLLVERIDR
jgi:hypothetical protein